MKSEKDEKEELLQMILDLQEEKKKPIYKKKDLEELSVDDLRRVWRLL